MAEEGRQILPPGVPMIVREFRRDVAEAIATNLGQSRIQLANAIGEVLARVSEKLRELCAESMELSDDECAQLERRWQSIAAIASRLSRSWADADATMMEIVRRIYNLADSESSQERRDQVAAIFRSIGTTGEYLEPETVFVEAEKILDDLTQVVTGG